jgi:metal-responsive CopG/Arc/MetJ family transcriptional regulator
VPRGGKRVGAGRRSVSKKKVRVTISLPPDMLAKIDKRAYQYPGPGRSQIITELIARALGSEA